MWWTDEGLAGARGAELYYREAGSGDPVVLLHGFPQTGHCWRDVAAKLASEHRVLVPDLPGYGRSARPPAFDAATLAGTVVSWMDAVGAPRATIVGHDWGGGIAYRLAGAHPEATDRLIVINSPYRRVDLKAGWYMIAFNIPVLPEVAFALAGPRIVDLFLRAGSRDASVFAGDATAEYRHAFRSPERARNAIAYYRTVTRRALLQALPGRARGDRPGRITAPTMIVWGMDDPALPPALLDDVARDIPHARIERLADTGHFVPEERPDVVAALIAAFAAEGRAT